MTEHKFTDEEIVEILNAYVSKMCGKCNVKDLGVCCSSCFITAIPQALDLINRQKAEINALYEINRKSEDQITELRKALLRRQNLEESFSKSVKQFDKKLERTVKLERAEAVKEFAEYLKKYYRHIDKTAGALIEYTIDAKATEFLGGNVCGANTETEK